MATGLEIKQTRTFRPLKWVVRVIFLALLIAIGYYGLRWYNTGELPFPLPIASASPNVNETPITAAQRQAHSVSADQPRFLSIAKLGIKNARVIPIKLTSQKQLELPKYLDDVGWYSQSALPGQEYGVVMLNGYSQGKTRAGVFAELPRLQHGDSIQLERGDGKVISYEVRSNQQLPTAQAISSGIQDAAKSIDETKEGLSIITPSGRWVPKDSDFSERTILRAIRK